MLKRTSLYQTHVQLGAKIVEFGGWEMPVQYTSLSDEHETCRSKCALFDVSHMGELHVTGKNALSYLQKIATNNVAKIKDNQAQYTVACYENGGCVDDLIIHRNSSEDFFICVNASNTDKDYEWFKKNLISGVDLKNVSSEYSQIAVQGKFAVQTIQPLLKYDLSLLKYYWFIKAEMLGETVYLARTGYTGEDGFEIYCSWNSGPKFWSALMECGQKFGIKPAGLGARDTLRTEMKFPLYGHEIDQDHDPLQAGLGWVVKLDKDENFIGKSSLLKLKTEGLKRTIVGLKSLDRQIPRQGYIVENNNTQIGEVTSGTLSPSLKYGIAIARIDREFSKIGTLIDVVVRGNKVKHEVVETPFYKRPY